MVRINSAVDLQQTNPVRPTRPVAPRTQQAEDKQNQILEQATRQETQVLDEDIGRALQAYEQRNRQTQDDATDITRDTIDNDTESVSLTGYNFAGNAQGANANSYAARGSFIDFYV